MNLLRVCVFNNACNIMNAFIARLFASCVFNDVCWVMRGVEWTVSRVACCVILSLMPQRIFAFLDGWRSSLFPSS
jgi:hypothetical protein